MCGIGGFRRFGEAPPITPTHVKTMLCGLQKRGTNAAGIALQYPNGEIYVMKEPMPAWQLVIQKRFDEFLADHLEQAQTVLLHARAATQGDPEDNRNNHPLFTGKTVVVHNGKIENDYILFRELKLEREGAVDSDIIRALLDDSTLSKDGIAQLRKLKGSGAIAALSVEQPGKLLLARSGNPMVWASVPELDLFCFASTKQFLHQTLRPVYKWHEMLFQPNIPNVGFSTMTNHSAHIIGDNGLEWHEALEFNTHFTAPIYDQHNIYRRGREKWKTEALPEHLLCLNSKCKRAVRIPDAMKEFETYELECPHCGEPLGVQPEGIIKTSHVEARA